MKLMRNTLLLIALTSISLLSGCATVTRGSSVDWVVDTEPAGAMVTTSLGDECVTPCTLKLKRKTAFDVTIRKAGYRPVEARVIAYVSGKGTTALAGNILAGGVLGMAIDFSSGAANDLKPNPLLVTLEAGDEADAITWLLPPEEPAQKPEATDDAVSTGR